MASVNNDKIFDAFSRLCRAGDPGSASNLKLLRAAQLVAVWVHLNQQHLGDFLHLKRRMRSGEGPYVAAAHAIAHVLNVSLSSEQAEQVALLIAASRATDGPATPSDLRRTPPPEGRRT